MTRAGDGAPPGRYGRTDMRAGLPGPCEPLAEYPFGAAPEVRLAPEDAGLLDHLGLRRIGMDRAGQRLDAPAGLHQCRDLADQIAGMRGDDGGPDDAVRSLFDVDSCESMLLSVEDGAVDLI